MIRNRKTENNILFFVSLISVLELYFLYRVTIAYQRVYKIGGFIVLVFAKSLVVRLLLTKKNIASKFIVLATILVYVLLPLIVYFTLPNYTYNEGKEIVEQSLQQNAKFSFVDNSYGEYSIPISENSNQLFISNREYYYIINFLSETKHFIINPLTGKLTEKSEKYW